MLLKLSRTGKLFAFVYVNRVINTVKEKEDNVGRLDAILLNEDLITRFLKYVRHYFGSCFVLLDCPRSEERTQQRRKTLQQNDGLLCSSS